MDFKFSCRTLGTCYQLPIMGKISEIYIPCESVESP